MGLVGHLTGLLCSPPKTALTNSCPDSLGGGSGASKRQALECLGLGEVRDGPARDGFFLVDG
jgi:hypothetical protein